MENSNTQNDIPGPLSETELHEGWDSQSVRSVDTFWSIASTAVGGRETLEGTMERLRTYMYNRDPYMDEEARSLRWIDKPWRDIWEDLLEDQGLKPFGSGSRFYGMMTLPVMSLQENFTGSLLIKNMEYLQAVSRPATEGFTSAQFSAILNKAESIPTFTSFSAPPFTNRDQDNSFFGPFPQLQTSSGQNCTPPYPPSQSAQEVYDQQQPWFAPPPQQHFQAQLEQNQLEHQHGVQQALPSDAEQDQSKSEPEPEQQKDQQNADQDNDSPDSQLDQDDKSIDLKAEKQADKQIGKREPTVRSKFATAFKPPVLPYTYSSQEIRDIVNSTLGKTGPSESRCSTAIEKAAPLIPFMERYELLHEKQREPYKRLLGKLTKRDLKILKRAKCEPPGFHALSKIAGWEDFDVHETCACLVADHILSTPGLIYTIYLKYFFFFFEH